MLHLREHNPANHRIFGMNGHGVSFNCFACDKLVENRLPVHRGEAPWFCSFPCARNTVSLFDGQVVNFSNDQWRWRSIAGNWFPVVPDSVMEIAIHADDRCLDIMTRPKGK